MENPLRSERGRQLRSDELLRLFGLKPTSPIPPDYEATKEINGVQVHIIPQPVPGRRRHRVLVSCVCDELVPAGRMHQHLKRKGHQ